MDKQVFFENPKAFRDWLAKNHQSEDVLWICYYKKHTGKPSISYEESVEEALCFGWIDGIKKSIDDISYKHRFTPRRKKSNWSKRNIDTVERLIKLNRMTKTGLLAFSRRNAEKSSVYSYEKENAVLSANYLNILKEEKVAWNFYNSLTPSVKRLSVNWIMSAKKEETRDRRFSIFFENCSTNQLIPQLR